MKFFQRLPALLYQFLPVFTVRRGLGPVDEEQIRIFHLQTLQGCFHALLRPFIPKFCLPYL
jgi:hypothetical protein